MMGELCCFCSTLSDFSKMSAFFQYINFNKLFLLNVMNNDKKESVQFSSVAQSYQTLRPHGLQHARPPCPSPTPRAYSNSCPLSQWCQPTISSSVIPFSSHLQSFSASRTFPVSQFFTSSGQSIEVSASATVLPLYMQDWFPLGWTGWISLQSKGLSKVFSNTTVQKHQFFSAQLFICVVLTLINAVVISLFVRTEEFMSSW